jgi:hypothetical protein
VLADEMVVDYKMPSLDELLDAVQAVRQKNAPKVRDASAGVVVYLGQEMGVPLTDLEIGATSEVTCRAFLRFANIIWSLSM